MVTHNCTTWNVLQEFLTHLSYVLVIPGNGKPFKISEEGWIEVLKFDKLVKTTVKVLVEISGDGMQGMLTVGEPGKMEAVKGHQIFQVQPRLRMVAMERKGKSSEIFSCNIH